IYPYVEIYQIITVTRSVIDKYLFKYDLRVSDYIDPPRIPKVRDDDYEMTKNYLIISLYKHEKVGVWGTLKF
ncbi:MAG: hypothetical protein WBY71_09675, partial [Nitrososphaeraceae archaeon]